MSRGFTISHLGKYKVVMDGTLVGTFNGQSYYESLVRSDSRPGNYVLGMRIPTGYSARKTTHMGPYGSWTRKQYGRTYVRTGDLYSMSSGSYLVKGWTVPAYDRGLQSAALIELYDRLKGLSSDVNLATNVAEGRESIALLTSTVRSLAKSYKYARKGLIRDIAYGIGKRDGSRYWKRALKALGIHGTKPARNLGGRVLQYNLGVAPLLGDINQAIQDYMKSGPNAVFITRVDGNAGSPKLGGATKYIDDQGFLPMEVSYQESNYAKARLYVRLRSSAQANDAALGVTAFVVPTNPLALAYELTGLSWMVDYAWNLSGWLNAIDAPYGWIFVTGYMSLRAESKATFSSFSSPMYGQSTVSGYRRNFSFDRQVYDNFPVPPPPAFENPVSLKHALNAVAYLGTLT